MIKQVLLKSNKSKHLTRLKNLANTPLIALIAFFMLQGCISSGEKKAPATTSAPATATATTETTVPDPTPAHRAPSAPGDSVSDVKGIPILCYHQIRDWKPTDSKFQRVYIIPTGAFKEQMQILHDSGYHAVLPDQLIAHMMTGAKLPSKPIMLTFDDAPESQIENGLPELNKQGFKAVFFIMTVVLGHNNYMTSDQVKKLFDQGHVIGCHTWNHTMVTKYKTQADYTTQVDKPRALLEKITGAPIKYFAYPFGIWNTATADYLKKAGFTAAFQLFGKQDEQRKYFVIRRIIANPNWNGQQLLKNIRHIK